MQAQSKNLSGSARSLMFVAILSQAGLAFGGITPLRSESPRWSQAAVANPEVAVPPSSSTVLDRINVGAVTVPVIELTPTATQAAAPASVPLPPALETGLSGGAALMIAAGLRKLRRLIRRGF